MGCYIVGLSFLAQRETLRGEPRYWPLIFLAAPVVLALIVNRGVWQMRGLALCAVLVLWIVWCLRFVYWTPQRNVARAVGGLLAGIALVDLLSVAGGGALNLFIFFLACFGAALLCQRFVPAT
jgi:4-hydroxybenzoate polyprenyltransferase